MAQASLKIDLPGGPTAAGALYAADTLPLPDVIQTMPFTRPGAIAVGRMLAPALLVAVCYLPGAFSDNRLERNQRGGLRIVGGEKSETGALFDQLRKALATAMRQRGALHLPSPPAPLPGTDAHYAGTLPMTTRPTDGPSCTPQGEIRDLPGLFVADGAALPVLHAKHCTFTIMANADRIGRVLAAG